VDLAGHVAEFVFGRLGAGAETRIAIACSGGPDSAVLADIAMALSRAGRLGPVTLAHVDHGLRPESSRDAEQVRELARAGGAQFALRRVVVDTSRASLEEAAREARYAALDSIADEVGAAWVLLAHTASDQAETVLMRILRGTGVAGLAGMAAVRARYARPLLDVSRADVEAEGAARGLAALDDPMNRDVRFARVRVRHQILPALRQENPNIEEALCRLADSAREAREVIERDVGDAGEGANLRARDVVALPAAVAKRALAMAAERAGVGPLEARHLDAVVELAGRPDAGTVAIDVPGGRAIREYGALRFQAPGGGNGRVEIAPEPRSGYTIRLLRAGDRMRPRRLAGRSRKLSDLLVDAKIPREARAAVRVVVRDADGEIVWADHIGPAFQCEDEVSLTAPPGVATNKD
jgi:tRNA(Ile)-lysidine synthase